MGSLPELRVVFSSTAAEGSGGAGRPLHRLIRLPLWSLQGGAPCPRGQGLRRAGPVCLRGAEVSSSALAPAGGERVVERVAERLRGLQPWGGPAGPSAFLTHVRRAGGAAAPEPRALGRRRGWAAALQAPLPLHGQGLGKEGKLRRKPPPPGPARGARALPSGWGSADGAPHALRGSWLEARVSTVLPRFCGRRGTLSREV